MRTEEVQEGGKCWYWSWTLVMDFRILLYFLIWPQPCKYIFPFPLTLAKSIGNDQTISNGAANCQQHFAFCMFLCWQHSYFRRFFNHMVQSTMYIICTSNTAATNLIKLLSLLPFFYLRLH
jgi:hypothetical protein